MKKLITILASIFILSILFKSEKIISVMNENDNKGSGYELIFDEELLNFRNFKLKLGLFTSYEYNITKVYIKYPEYIDDILSDKEYYSFNSNNFNNGLEKFKNEYIELLKNKYLYNEIEKDIDETKIYKVEIYAEDSAIKRFKDKYPLVKVKQIDKY